MQIWRFWKKVQKNLEIGTSDLEISKICVTLKKKNNRLFVWVFFYLFSALAEVSKTYQSHLWFCFALPFWATSSHSEICACVRRISLPRVLSAPMFRWNWHYTQVFSQISLIMNTDYSIFLHTLRNFFGNFKVFWFTVRFGGKTVRPWDGIPNRESHGQTVRVGRPAYWSWSRDMIWPVARTLGKHAYLI